jgi:AraC-like DNA-binding protein
VRAEGDLSWAEIAVLAGFADQSQFIRATNTVFGGSPEQVMDGIRCGRFHWRWPRHAESCVALAPRTVGSVQ